MLSGKVRVGNVKVLASSRWSLSLVLEAGGWYSQWEGQWFFSDIIAMEWRVVQCSSILYLLLNILLIRTAHCSNICFYFHLTKVLTECVAIWDKNLDMFSDPTWPLPERNMSCGRYWRLEESWRANDVMKMIDNSVLSLFTLRDGCGIEAVPPTLHIYVQCNYSFLIFWKSDFHIIKGVGEQKISIGYICFPTFPAIRSFNKIFVKH